MHAKPLAKRYTRTLGLSKDATAEEIREAYYRLAFKHHPDRNPGDAYAAARFKKIQISYEWLCQRQAEPPPPTTEQFPFVVPESSPAGLVCVLEWLGAIATVVALAATLTMMLRVKPRLGATAPKEAQQLEQLLSTDDVVVDTDQQQPAMLRLPPSDQGPLGFSAGDIPQREKDYRSDRFAPSSAENWARAEPDTVLESDTEASPTFPDRGFSAKGHTTPSSASADWAATIPSEVSWDPASTAATVTGSDSGLGLGVNPPWTRDDDYQERPDWDGLNEADSWETVNGLRWWRSPQASHRLEDLEERPALQRDWHLGQPTDWPAGNLQHRLPLNPIAKEEPFAANPLGGHSDALPRPNSGNPAKSLGARSSASLPVRSNANRFAAPQRQGFPLSSGAPGNSSPLLGRSEDRQSRRGEKLLRDWRLNEAKQGWQPTMDEKLPEFTSPVQRGGASWQERGLAAEYYGKPYGGLSPIGISGRDPEFSVREFGAERTAIAGNMLRSAEATALFSSIQPSNRLPRRSQVQTEKNFLSPSSQIAGFSPGSARDLNAGLIPSRRSSAPAARGSRGGTPSARHYRAARPSRGR